MTERNGSIDLLLEKLDLLLKRQDNFSREIKELQDEIQRLKSSQLKEQVEEITIIPPVEPLQEPVIEAEEENVQSPGKFHYDNTANIQPGPWSQNGDETTGIKSNIEKFIGENLISKIGIIILVVGVAIGAKYSIEHQLISPTARIILGYLVGDTIAKTIVFVSLGILLLVISFLYHKYKLLISGEDES